jgi:hypothetical protein
LLQEDFITFQDTLIALEIMRSQFPKIEKVATKPFVLRSQLYSSVKDRTQVDRELEVCVAYYDIIQGRILCFMLTDVMLFTFLMARPIWWSLCCLFAFHLLLTGPFIFVPIRKLLMHQLPAQELRPINLYGMQIYIVILRIYFVYYFCEV